MSLLCELAIRGPHTPYDVECRVRITSFDPLDDKAFALIKCSGTLVACEVLDAKPRRVGRQILKDALNQGGSEATTAIVRIEIRLVKDVVRSVAPALGNANNSALCLCNDDQPAEGGGLNL